MTKKQKSFCLEYMKDLNATKAAIRAGYSEKTARNIGHNLLSTPEVKTYLDKEMSKREERTLVTSDMTIEELAMIAFSDIREYIDSNNDINALKGLPKKYTSAVASIEIDKKKEKGVVITTKKIKLYDKLKALEMLGKHLGIFEKDNRQKASIKVGFDDDDDE